MLPTDPLERNVAALLRHAWRPVGVRPEFRARLEREFVAGLAERAGETARRRPRPIPARGPWLPAALVAAAAAVVAWVGVRALLAPTAPGSGPTLAELDRPSPAASPDGAAYRPATRPEPRALPGDGPRDRRTAAGPEPADAPLAEPAADGDAAGSEDTGGAPATILVRITPPEGVEAVEGLRVALLPEAEMPEVVDPLLVTPERVPGGRRLAGLPGGAHRLFLRAEGGATWQRRVELAPGETLELDVELARGLTARGRVVDPAGMPVEGALVVSQTEMPLQVLSNEVAELEHTGAPFAHTGPDGRFELGPLAPGEQVLRASAAGFGTVWTTVTLDADPTPDDRATLTLAPAARVEGRVSDALGAPTEGALVIGSLFDADSPGAKRFYVEARTDAEGRYALEDLPGGMFVVLLFDGASAEMRSMSPTYLAPGEEATVDFLAGTPRSSLGGTLLDPSGAPRDGHVVTLARLRDDGGFDGDGWRASGTDAAGRFRFDDLVPGHYGILVAERAGLDMGLVERVDLAEAVDLDLTLTLDDHGLSARVVGPDGSPVGGVALLMVDDGPRELFAGRRTVGPDGRLEFRGLPDGLYALWLFPFDADAAMVLARPVTVSGGTTELALELGPAGGVDLHVVDADGAPLPDARLELTSPTGVRLIDDGRLRTDAEGRGRLTNLPAGAWRLRVEHPGHAPLERTVNVVAGRDRDLDLTLPENR